MLFLAKIKISIKSIFSQGIMVFITFGIVPLLLVFIFSFINGDFVNSIQEIPTIEVTIIDHDNSDISKEITTLFKNTPFKLVDKEADFEITIPNGYQASIINNEKTIMEAMTIKEPTYVSEQLFFSVLDSYNDLLNESLFIASQDEILDKEAFITKIALLKMNSSIQSDYLEDVYTRSSFDSSLVNVSGFVFFMLLYNIGASAFMLNDGLKQRVHSFPITKTRQLHDDIIEAFIFSFMLLFVSYGLFMVFSNEMRIHLPYFILVIMIQAMLLSVLSLFISSFLPKALANGLMMMLMIMDMVLASSGYAFLSFLKDFSIGEVIHDLFEYALMGDLNRILTFGGISILVTLGTYLLLRVKVLIKWKGQA